MSIVDSNRLEAAYQTALAALLAERTAEGHWVGELSTSALSTATAVTALSLVQKHTQPGRFDSLISRGVAWLIEHQNADGGWGDTVKSISNISTSMLVRAVLESAGEAKALARLEEYLNQHCGKTPAERAEAIRRRYGKDRTFAVPILTMCALAGLVPWKEVTPLPFELACFPQSWFRFLRLPVVSYALPALIGIGQAIHHHRRSLNPLTRIIRSLAKSKSLRVLEKIQPTSGGFLEATPLTSFVTMSLASIGHAEHPVAKKGVEFIVNSVRPDGSWPIDSNLATWVTTLSINALAAAGALESLDRKDAVRDWLLKQQFRERHPYTGADPGGWGWTDLPGSVPDADDTPGALLSLYNIDDSSLLVVDGEEPENEDYHRTYRFPLEFRANCYFGEETGLMGLDWLLALQNSDGGWPTFCRGWGALPFDRSGSDLTAHGIRAINTWVGQIERVWREFAASERLQREDGSVVALMGAGHHGQKYVVREAKLRAGLASGLAFLARTQRLDGSWLPLWFGNQHAPNDENPTYGTARVLAAYRDLDMMDAEPARRGVAWLLAAQNPDGGWGGDRGVPSSIEETALALEVLLAFSLESRGLASLAPGLEAVNNAVAWLVQKVESGGLNEPTPIGFYFAKLWYFEKLYPIIFTVAALGRARLKLQGRLEPTHPETSR
jgi:squalene-hopene/tetraprenyl-beta-curcumene cyclase